MRSWLIALLLVFASIGVSASVEAAPKDKDKDCISPPGQMKKAAAPAKAKDAGKPGRQFCTPTPAATTTPTPVPGSPTPTATPTPWPTGAADRFDRPDSPVLGRADSNQVWEEWGDWRLCSRQACPEGPPDDGLYAKLPTNLQGQRAAVTLSARPVGAAGQAALLVQATPDWGRYMVYVGLTSEGRVEVWTLTNFEWSDGPIAAADTGLDSGAPRRLEARAVPGSVTVLIDGRQVLGPVALPQPPPDATYAGIYAETTDPSPTSWPRFDLFSVTRER